MKKTVRIYVSSFFDIEVDSDENDVELKEEFESNWFDEALSHQSEMMENMNIQEGETEVIHG